MLRREKLKFWYDISRKRIQQWTQQADSLPPRSLYFRERCKQTTQWSHMGCVLGKIKLEGGMVGGAEFTEFQRCEAKTGIHIRGLSFLEYPAWALSVETRHHGPRFYKVYNYWCESPREGSLMDKRRSPQRGGVLGVSSQGHHNLRKEQGGASLMQVGAQSSYLLSSTYLCQEYHRENITGGSILPSHSSLPVT